MRFFLSTGQQIASSRIHRRRIGCLRNNPFSPHTLLTASQDHTLKVVDLRVPRTDYLGAPQLSGVVPSAGCVTSVLRGHRQEVCGASWSDSREHVVASGSNDNHVGVWDLRGGAWLRKAHKAGIKAVAWHNDTLVTAGGTNDKRVCMWKWGPGTDHLDDFAYSLHNRTDEEINSSLNPGGTFQPADYDHQFVNGAGGPTIGPVSFVEEKDAASQVCGVVWARGRPVTSHGYSQNCLCVWDTSPLTCLIRHSAHNSRTLFLASDGGDRVATGAADGTVKVWSVGEGQGRVMKHGSLDIKIR
jgi:WD40 repeat protein